MFIKLIQRVHNWSVLLVETWQPVLFLQISQLLLCRYSAVFAILSLGNLSFKGAVYQYFTKTSSDPKDVSVDLSVPYLRPPGCRNCISETVVFHRILIWFVRRPRAVYHCTLCAQLNFAHRSFRHFSKITLQGTLACLVTASRVTKLGYKMVIIEMRMLALLGCWWTCLIHAIGYTIFDFLYDRIIPFLKFWLIQNRCMYEIQLQIQVT